jgi:hypothetical protein
MIKLPFHAIMHTYSSGIYLLQVRVNDVLHVQKIAMMK